MKEQTYNGRKFMVRKDGYFTNRTSGDYLHRCVWEDNYGLIPSDCHVHHKNRDKSDNRIENLELLSASAHSRLHGKDKNKWRGSDAQKKHLEKVRPMTHEWRKTKEGHDSHVAAAKKGWEGRQPIEKICIECGEKYMTRHTGKSLYCSGRCKQRFNYKRRQRI